MQTQYRATGRRKTSIAQVRLLAGSGNFTINGRDINDYFDSGSTSRSALATPCLTAPACPVNPPPLTFTITSKDARVSVNSRGDLLTSLSVS